MLTEKEYPVLRTTVKGVYPSSEIRRIARREGRGALLADRSTVARILLKAREIARIERRMPEVATAVEKRAKQIFRGIDPSVSGDFRKGKIDFSVTHEEDERVATASINGSEVAHISYWRNPTFDTPYRIYSLRGNIDGKQVELSYHEGDTDSRTGEIYEPHLAVRVFNPDGSVDGVINTARPILAIATQMQLVA